MRHRVYGRHLGRTKNERASLFKNLIGALILHGSIETTGAKAKAVKGLIDRIINQAKSKDTKRLVEQFLTQRKIQEKLYKEIVPRLVARNSGYTSIIKIGQRIGDGAMMVRMSLLVSEQGTVSSEQSNKKTSGRSGRSNRKTILTGGRNPRSSKNKK